MPSAATLALTEKLKRLPPGTEPVFAKPDIARKEAACRDPLLGSGHYRKAPTYVPPPKFRPPPSLAEPPKAPIMDRCIPAWPDPNTANIRPYMNANIGTYTHRRTWGVPYKSARGMHNPPQCTPVVYDL